jgi:hypothetical protein
VVLAILTHLAVAIVLALDALAALAFLAVVAVLMLLALLLGQDTLAQIAKTEETEGANSGALQHPAAVLLRS